MPGFDGTGPMGLGPRTGGGFGFCSPGAGVGAPRGFASGVVYGVGRGGIPRGGGRGRAFGGGRGRWWGMGGFPYRFHPCWPVAPYPTVQPADERGLLEDQVAYLEQELAAVKQRLAEMATAPEEQ
jgi:hypothetical protein